MENIFSLKKTENDTIEKIYHDIPSDSNNFYEDANGDNDNSSPAINGERETKVNREYYCDKCDYYTIKTNDYTKHLNTKKHKARMISVDDDDESKHKCSFCDKKYSSASNLWKHKQKCKLTENGETIQHKKKIIEDAKRNNELTNEMVLELIKQNKELQKALVDQSAAMLEQNTKLVEMTSKGSTHITNNNNTTNNNQFNVNFFLNEQCKNAVNIIDFVNSLQVQIQDLEKTGKLGYVEGISSIFLKGLRQLNVYERPIHCTDLKRETLYVKDKDSWEKDDADKAKLRTAIKHIARKNLKTLPKWQEVNPDFSILDTKENNEYLKIALNSLGGQTEEEEEKFTDKIIRNVLKDVLIDKKQ
jgi:hypothetical protein